MKINLDSEHEKILLDGQIRIKIYTFNFNLKKIYINCLQNFNADQTDIRSTNLTDRVPCKKNIKFRLRKKCTRGNFEFAVFIM